MIDPTVIKEAVDLAIGNIDYTGYGESTLVLDTLSCNQLLATDTNNYAGAGVGTNIGGSAWDDLVGKSTDKVYTKIISRLEMLDIKNMINDIESTTLKNNTIQFIELYTLQQVNASTDDKLKRYWLKSFDLKFNKLKVCGTNFLAGEGATCTWTVPDGATEAKFQAWGAGASTNAGCCCGGSSFGANGAYSELTIVVTPGDTYTLCAGCTCSQSCCSNYQQASGCMSGVIGNGICCFKADGGSTTNKLAMNSMRLSTGAGAICCRFQNNYCTSSGPCFCAYGEYCFDNSCSTCGIVPVHANCCVAGYCACGTDVAEVHKDGYRSLHGGGCLDTSFYGYHTRPPLLDSDTCANFVGGCSCGTFTSGSCCGGCLGNGWTKHPGHGGAHVQVKGGSNTFLSGQGTGGMIQVSWS